MSEVVTPRDASYAATLYCKLLGRNIRATLVDTHTMSSIEWQVFQIEGMNEKLREIFKKIEEHFEGRIWKGFVRKNGCYRIYVKPDESISTAASVWKITEFECFQLRIKNEEYSDNIGFCLKLS